MRLPSLFCLLSAALLAASAGAAAVRTPLAPALGLVSTVPAFRGSLLSQIQLATTLSAQTSPSLAPLLSAAPSPADPWRAESARLVAALTAQPQVLAAHQEELREVLGDYSVDLLQKAAARLQAAAASDGALRAQLDGIARELDLADQASGEALAARLQSLFDAARARAASDAAVAVPAGPGRKPLVTLGRPGERPQMSPVELEAYVLQNSVTSPRGLKRVNFASGDYRPSYDAALRAHGVDMVVIKAPSRAELARMREDDGYHLKSEYVRWVIPARGLEEHEASLPTPRARKNFRGELQRSAGVPFQVAPLTVERFEQWYPIYEDEVVGKPGGKRNVRKDFARALREQGALGDRYGGFYFDPADPTRMIGGVIMRAWAEKGMLVGNFAAYRPELKGVSPALRTFAEGLKLAASLGLPVFSLGEDTDFYGYDYNVGLMANKAGLQVVPYPSDEIVLMKVLDTAKIASNRDKQGRNAGYLFFGIKRDSPLVERYLASRESGPEPKEAQDLLGGRFFTPQILPVHETVVAWHFHGDDPTPPRTPTGIDVIRRPMAPPSESR